MLGHERPEAVSPERGVVLADLQSSSWLSTNFSLSLSLSLRDAVESPVHMQHAADTCTFSSHSIASLAKFSM